MVNHQGDLTHSRSPCGVAQDGRPIVGLQWGSDGLTKAVSGDTAPREMAAEKRAVLGEACGAVGQRGRTVNATEVAMRYTEGYRREARTARAVMLVTVLNFAAALAGLISAWRWFQTTTIKPPTELSFGGPTTVDAAPLVAFVREIGRLNRRAASWTGAAALLEGLATIAHYYGI